MFRWRGFIFCWSNPKKETLATRLGINIESFKRAPGTTAGLQVHGGASRRFMIGCRVSRSVGFSILARGILLRVERRHGRPRLGINIESFKRAPGTTAGLQVHGGAADPLRAHDNPMS
jgi:hypothetical protein